MAVSIACSYGGKFDNSYLELTHATDVIQNSGHFLTYDDWVAASPDEKSTALIMATNLIDGLRWVGAKFFYQQSLEFPRVLPGREWPWGGFDPRAEPDPSFYTYVQAAEDQRLMRLRLEVATAATALYVLARGGEFAERDIYYAGRQSYSRGSRFSEGSSFREPPSPIPPLAWDRMRYYRSHGPRLVRG